MVGLLIVYFFWGGWLLQCGDIEPNPGPKSSKRLHLDETDPQPGTSSGLTLTSPPKRPCLPEQRKVSANCVLCKGCGKTIQVLRSHLSRSVKCQVFYDMDELEETALRRRKQLDQTYKQTERKREREKDGVGVKAKRAQSEQARRQKEKEKDEVGLKEREARKRQRSRQKEREKDEVGAKLKRAKSEQAINT